MRIENAKIVSFLKFVEVLRILKMLTNFKNKIRYREKLTIEWKYLMQKRTCKILLVEENSILMSAEPTLAC